MSTSENSGHGCTIGCLRNRGKVNLYAYDAYVICCAMVNRCALISLDTGLVQAAKLAEVDIVEVLP